MSRCISIINDELKERATVGQGWDGFYLWTADDNTVLALNYMANRAFNTNTTLRFVDEYQVYDNNDETIFKYNDVSVANMERWLYEHYPKYYNPSPPHGGEG